MKLFLYILKIFLIFATWIGWSSYQPIRGKSIAPSTSLMIDTIKKIDNMAKRITQEDFIMRSKQVHGDTAFSYEKTKFISSHKNVLITCNKCGTTFEQNAYSHLRGCGCPECWKVQNRIINKGAIRKKRKLICGIGINDFYENSVNEPHTRNAYHCWVRMLQRCYDPKYRNRRNVNVVSTVCEEWKRFSNFKEWYDKNYIDGYDLDKDILIQGNTIYSPSTCCFVPHDLNSMIGRTEKYNTPKCIRRVSKNCYYMNFRVRNIDGYKGESMYFNNIKDAIAFYKKVKEKYFRLVAKKYYEQGRISLAIYNAIMNFELQV